MAVDDVVQSVWAPNAIVVANHFLANSLLTAVAGFAVCIRFLKRRG